MLEIDGSKGEGGGQLLRCTVALSAVTGKEVRISNIRAKRPSPGLAPQHLAAVRGVASLSSASVEGASAGSKELTFRPGRISGGALRVDVGTAGSISLVLQACLLPSVRAETRTTIDISGGTNVRWSPPIDSYRLVLLPLLRRMGVEIGLQIEGRGFFPEGGGRVRAFVEPAESLSPIDLRERGDFVSIEGVCFSQNLPEHVCTRMAHSVRRAFVSEGKIVITAAHSTGRSTGAGVCLCAEYEWALLGADALGERGMPSEKVGEEAAARLRREMASGGTLDVHASDQLLPYMALSGERSSFRVREVTEHLRTQMWLISEFLGTSFETSAIPGGFEIEVRP